MCKVWQYNLHSSVAFLKKLSGLFCFLRLFDALKTSVNSAERITENRNTQEKPYKVILFGIYC